MTSFMSHAAVLGRPLACSGELFIVPFRFKGGGDASLLISYSSNADCIRSRVDCMMGTRASSNSFCVMIMDFIFVSSGIDTIYVSTGRTS